MTRRPSFGFFVLAIVLLAGCAGGHSSGLPAGQAPAGSLTAREMDSLYPQSQSPGSFTVTPMAQTAKQPVSAMAGAPRGVAPQSIGTLSWSQLPGAATSVAPAPDGSLWAISAAPAGANKYIWHYANGTWANVPGLAANIAVGPDGTLYAVNSSSGGLYAYNGSSWSALGGGAAWVTAGADGSVYVISNGNAVNGNAAIWKYSGGAWTQQPGAGAQVTGSFDPSTYSVSGVGTVAPDGFFVVNASGSIYYYSPGKGYVSFPGAASSVSATAGGLFALAYPASASGESPYYFDYAAATWIAEPGSGIAIAAGSNAAGPQLYVVNSAGGIFTTPIQSTAHISGLHVSGNEILNGAGRQIVPHGVNFSGTEYACVGGGGGGTPWGIFDGPNDQTAVSAMLTWGIDVVRVPLNEDCWLGINGVAAAYSGANYVGAIQNYVNLLNANGIIAILDLHWNAPGTSLAVGQEPMADADHSAAFWTSVATTFKNDSAVMFDLYNEPYGIPWSCWVNGGTAAACGTTYDVAGMNALISAVRATGATNIVLAGGLAYSNDLSGWLANKPTDPAGNLMANWHVYSFNTCDTTACYNSTAAPVAAQVPLIADEIGESDCAHGFIDPLMAWLDTQKSGYLGWTWDTWDCDSGPALISDYTGTPTGFGLGLKNHLATLNQ
jgi:hypothetical protein